MQSCADLNMLHVSAFAPPSSRKRKVTTETPCCKPAPKAACPGDGLDFANAGAAGCLGEAAREHQPQRPLHRPPSGDGGAQLPPQQGTSTVHPEARRATAVLASSVHEHSHAALSSSQRFCATTVQAVQAVKSVLSQAYQRRLPSPARSMPVQMVPQQAPQPPRRNVENGHGIVPKPVPRPMLSHQPVMPSQQLSLPLVEPVATHQSSQLANSMPSVPSRQAVLASATTPVDPSMELKRTQRLLEQTQQQLQNLQQRQELLQRQASGATDGHNMGLQRMATAVDRPCTSDDTCNGLSNGASAATPFPRTVYAQPSPSGQALQPLRGSALTPSASHLSAQKSIAAPAASLPSTSMQPPLNSHQRHGASHEVQSQGGSCIREQTGPLNSLTGMPHRVQSVRVPAAQPAPQEVQSQGGSCIREQTGPLNSLTGMPHRVPSVRVSAAQPVYASAAQSVYASAAQPVCASTAQPTYASTAQSIYASTAGLPTQSALPFTTGDADGVASRDGYCPAPAPSRLERVDPIPAHLPLPQANWLMNWATPLMTSCPRDGCSNRRT